MVKKTRKMIGHGDGILAKKAVDIALRHKNVEVTSTEAIKSKYGQYLKMLGLKEKPANLNVKGKTNSAKYLKTLRENSIDHQWAHFSSTSMSYYVRRAFFEEVFRTLKPGRNLTIIDSGMAGQEICNELKRAGFKVSMRRLSPEEILKLKTPDAINFARRTEIDITKNLFAYNGKIPKQVLRELQEGWIKLKTSTEPKINPEVLASIRRVAQQMQKSMSEKPFAKIVAVKTRR